MEQGSSLTEEFKHKRVRQILWATFFAFFGVAIGTLLFGSNKLNLAIYCICLLILSFNLQLLRRNKVDLAATFTLWIITLICALLVFINEGLRDAGILTFPGLLIIGAMIGTPRLFLSLFIFITLYVIGLGLATIMHWVNFPTNQPVTGETISDIVVINSAIGFSVWLLASDLKKLLKNLEQENQRALSSQAEVAHIARHDVLTGLPNRALCEENFYQSLARSMRMHDKIAMIFIDIDNFKTINDSFGHTAGDKLLVEITNRIQANTRTNDRLSRLGGDEFLLVLENIKHNDSVSELVNKLQQIMAEPITVDQTQIRCTCSVGIAICPDDGTSFMELRKKSDMAMYKAKDTGRNTFCFYDEAMNTSMAEYLALVAGLRTAIAKQEFELYYQPKHEIASGKIIGAEALIRWRTQDGKMIPPNKFIAAAENTGLIIAIGEWVLGEACRECKHWHNSGFTDFTVAVNLSYVQFKRGNLNQTVLHHLNQSGLPPQALELELTESLLIDDSADIKQQLQELRKLGSSIAIDDFGTGYSNLGYLNKFEIGTLKIDQSFIFNIATQHHDCAIVRAIIQIAHSLGMTTVAEGVENQATLDLLKELDCDYFQGYLRAPALNRIDFLDYATQYIAS